MIKAGIKRPKAKSIQAALLTVVIMLGMFAAIPFSAAAAPADAPPEVLSGWQEMGGAWYYYINGIRQTGWIFVDGKDYYLGSNGKMTTGWVDWQGNRYYLSPEGEMMTGWLEQGGKWYYLDPASGTMTKGWVQYLGQWYFFDNKGVMQTGWVKANNSRYYFAPGGEMVTGWQMLDNRWHYFTPTGEMVTGWLPYEGKWYYMDKDGRMIAREWQRIGGVWYNFSANGSLYSSATGDGSPSLSDNQASFVDRYQAHAAALSTQYRIPWEAVMAQGILESAAGTSNFARNRNNFFGIGAVDYNPDNAHYYSSPEAGWEGYYRFIRDNGRYERHGVFHEPNVTDPYAYANAIKAAGYATDPNYVSKLHYLITGVLNRANSKGWSTTVLLLG